LALHVLAIPVYVQESNPFILSIPYHPGCIDYSPGDDQDWQKHAGIHTDSVVLYFKWYLSYLGIFFWVNISHHFFYPYPKSLDCIMFLFIYVSTFCVTRYLLCSSLNLFVCLFDTVNDEVPCTISTAVDMSLWLCNNRFDFLNLGSTHFYILIHHCD
jgi:hypothetical protein